MGNGHHSTRDNFNLYVDDDNMNAQATLNSIPTPIKNVIRRSLYISISALKEEVRDISPDTDEEVENLIQTMTLVHDKLGR